MDNNVDTIIGINVLLKGNLHNKGSILINGNVEGEVKSDENITVGETAKIKGPVVAKTIEVSGEVVGTVEATEKLEVHPTGKIKGDINAKSLIIQQGAIFVGKSAMPSTVKDDGTRSQSKSQGDKQDEPKKEEEPEDKSDKFGFFKK